MKMTMARMITMPAPTAPAIHATDSDNQPPVSATIGLSVVTALHVVSPDSRKKHRSCQIFYADISPMQTAKYYFKMSKQRKSIRL